MAFFPPSPSNRNGVTNVGSPRNWLWEIIRRNWHFFSGSFHITASSMIGLFNIV